MLPTKSKLELATNDLSAEATAPEHDFFEEDEEDDDDDRACAPHMFRCENSPCIPEHLHCNGVVDCPFDISDELDCDVLTRLCKSWLENFNGMIVVSDTKQRNGASCEVFYS